MSNVTARGLKRKERTASLLKDVVSSFIKIKISPASLVTVMGVEVTNDLRSAKAFISVFPKEKEREIISLLRKQNRRLKNFMKIKIKLRFLPEITFEVDKNGSWSELK